MSNTDLKQVGVVVIGRNEGERLKRCLLSLPDGLGPVIYVDSGSTDGSTAFAESVGALVVTLDMSLPFTAARARNAGLKRLSELSPQTAFVQFIDGDCEMHAGWFATALDRLSSPGGPTLVVGRMRERHPEASRYNRLCDLEWDLPVGRIDWCGGIFMARAASLRDVGGFDEALIAGEEPELCVRLRARGGTLERLNIEMGWHDAAMTRFGQWWKRAVRGGQAFAQSAVMHGASRAGFGYRNALRPVIWGLVLPTVIVFSLLASLWWPLALLLGAAGAAFYFLLLARVWAARRATRGPEYAGLYAFFCVLGKFPEAQGVLRFAALRLLKRRATLIEYK